MSFSYHLADSSQSKAGGGPQCFNLQNIKLLLLFLLFVVLKFKPQLGLPYYKEIELVDLKRLSIHIFILSLHIFLKG